MRAHTLFLFSILAAGAAVALGGWGFAAPNVGPMLADNRPNAVPADIELVIAVDVSNSMDPEEHSTGGSASAPTSRISTSITRIA